MSLAEFTRTAELIDPPVRLVYASHSASDSAVRVPPRQTGKYQRVVVGLERRQVPREPVPFELIEKIFPLSAQKTDADVPRGVYERILDRYPDYIGKGKHFLGGLLIAEVAIFSFLLGHDSDWVISAGVALFATVLLYAAFRSALANVVTVRNYRVTPEQEVRLLKAIDQLAQSH
jgi:hypothetical protein